MAVKPQDNSGFLREVDEEVRREQAAQFWQRWGLWMAIGIVLLLAAIGGYMYWSSQQRAAAEEETAQLDAIINDLGEGNTQDIEERLDALVESPRPGVRGAALFTRAGYALEMGDTGTAIELFGRAAADDGLPEEYRHLATIRQTALQFEELEPQQVIDRLSGLAEADNPFFGSAGELTALALLKSGDAAAAGEMFAAIAQDEDVPSTLRSRATQMAGVLGVDAVPDEPVEIEEQDAAPVAAAPEREEAE